MNDADGDGVCDELEVSGCLMTLLVISIHWPTDDDGLRVFAEPFTDCDGVCDEGYNNFGNGCELIVPGCNDITAFNYNPESNINNGSCYYTPGCTDVMRLITILTLILTMAPVLESLMAVLTPLLSIIIH